MGEALLKLFRACTRHTISHTISRIPASGRLPQALGWLLCAAQMHCLHRCGMTGFDRAYSVSMGLGHACCCGSTGLGHVDYEWTGWDRACFD